MADRDENVATFIIGAVMNLESSMTKYLAEASEEEIFNIQQRLASLEFQARQLVNPEGSE